MIRNVFRFGAGLPTCTPASGVLLIESHGGTELDILPSAILALTWIRRRGGYYCLEIDTGGCQVMIHCTKEKALAFAEWLSMDLHESVRIALFDDDEPEGRQC